MTITRAAITTSAVLALATLATAPLTVAQAQADEQVPVTWSDPSRPGLVKVASLNGSVTVKGSDRKDVLVIARTRGAGRQRPTPAPDSGGMRRLTQSPGFRVREERNVIDVEAESHNRAIDFEVLVPLRTNLQVGIVNGGIITVENVEGDMEIENVNGPVHLTNVGGSVVANSVNGGVKAVMTRVTAQKAMSFIAHNGNVDVTLPASTKATLKLRSDMSDVFTNFEIQETSAPAARVRDTRREANGRLDVEVNRAIHGTINGGGIEIELRTFQGNVYLRKGQ